MGQLPGAETASILCVPSCPLWLINLNAWTTKDTKVHKGRHCGQEVPAFGSDGAGTPVLGDEFEGASLLCRSSFFVGVDKNIGIEEATGVHESRFDRSASRVSGHGP